MYVNFRLPMSETKVELPKVKQSHKPKLFHQSLRTWRWLSNNSVSTGFWNRGVMISEPDEGNNDISDILFNPASQKITIDHVGSPRVFSFCFNPDETVDRDTTKIFPNLSPLKFAYHGLSKSDFSSISKNFLIPPSLPEIVFEIPPPPFIPSPQSKVSLFCPLIQSKVTETFIEKSKELQLVSRVKALEIASKVQKADYLDYKRGFREGIKLQKLRFARMKARKQDSQLVPLANGNTLIYNDFRTNSPRQGASPIPRRAHCKFSTVKPTRAEPQLKITSRRLSKKKIQTNRKKEKRVRTKLAAEQARRILSRRRQGKPTTQVSEPVEPYTPTRPAMFPNNPPSTPLLLDLFDTMPPTPSFSILNEVVSPYRPDLSLTPQREAGEDVELGIVTSYFYPR